MPLVQALVNQENTYLFSNGGKKFSVANYYKCWNEVMKKTERTRRHMKRGIRLKQIWTIPAAIGDALICSWDTSQKI